MLYKVSPGYRRRRTGTKGIYIKWEVRGSLRELQSVDEISYCPVSRGNGRRNKQINFYGARLLHRKTFTFEGGKDSVCPPSIDYSAGCRLQLYIRRFSYITEARDIDNCHITPVQYFWLYFLSTNADLFPCAWLGYII